MVDDFNRQIQGFYDIKKSKIRENNHDVESNNGKEVKMEEPKKDRPKNIDDWAEKSNKQLKDGDKPYRVFSLAWIYFLISIIILLLILWVGSFAYLGYTDHFKSDVNVSLDCGNTTITPSITIDKGLCPAPVCNSVCNCNLTAISYNSTNSSY